MKTRNTTRRVIEADSTSKPKLELEVLRQQCHVATPLANSVACIKEPKIPIHKKIERADVDNEQFERQRQQNILSKLCRLDVNPIQPLCGVALQCRRIQANLSQGAVARMTGSSEAFIDSVEIGIRTPSHELWERLVASIS